MRRFPFLLLTVAGVGFASNALAYSIDGSVYCDTDGQGGFDEGDTPFAGITILLENESGFIVTAVTQADGSYHASAGDGLGPGTWSVSIDGSSLNAEATVVLPATGTQTVTLSSTNPFQEGFDFLVDDPACQETTGACWMTAGGVKFEPMVDLYMAQKGPKDSFGGNVFPSRSPEPGDGGQWNHIAHSLKLHFLGTTITEVRCGNVDGIEPGSESPVTPFNFIEFSGTGWIQGIKGNKIPRTEVTFMARVEDHNEPGNEHAAAGENIDKYYLNVPGYIVVSDDGTEGGAPITITGGNLQLHSTSCD